MTLDWVLKYSGVQCRLIELRLLVLEVGCEGTESGADTDAGVEFPSGGASRLVRCRTSCGLTSVGGYGR